MHDLDRIQAEFADSRLDDDGFDEGASEDSDVVDEFDDDDFADELDEDDDDQFDELDDDDLDDDEDDWDGDAGIASDDNSPLDEDEEIELASELLAANNEEDLERAIRRIVRPRPHRRRRRRPPLRRSVSINPEEELFVRRRRNRKKKRRRGFLGKALRGIAKKALPIIGGAVGSLVAPGLGTAAGAALAKGAGKAFGLELEGLSPEDQEMAVARQIVRLGAEAGEEVDQVDPAVDDETAAKVGMIRAAGKHAPGVMPRPDTAADGGAQNPMPPRRGVGRRGGPGAGAQSGRWVRRDGRIVLLGL